MRVFSAVPCNGQNYSGPFPGPDFEFPTKYVRLHYRNVAVYAETFCSMRMYKVYYLPSYIHYEPVLLSLRIRNAFNITVSSIRLWLHAPREQTSTAVRVVGPSKPKSTIVLRSYRVKGRVIRASRGPPGRPAAVERLYDYQRAPTIRDCSPVVRAVL